MTKSTMLQAGPHSYAAMHLRLVTDEMMLQHLGNALEDKDSKIASLKRKSESLNRKIESLEVKYEILLDGIQKLEGVSHDCSEHAPILQANADIP